MRHPGIDKIAFTGSTATGVAIVRDSADHLPRVSLELGGKSPNVVFADADLDGALSGALAGIFAATGQTCIAGSRLLVQRTIHDEFVRRLAERAAQIRLGDPMLDDTETGPVAFEEHRENVLRYIDIGRSEGAEVVTGGNRPQDPALRNGCFVEPTVLVDVTNDMRVAREEIFGPVVAVIPFETEREAIEIANSTPFGLAAGAWTRDVHRAHRVAHAIKAGSVWINSYRAVSFDAPFGGSGRSAFDADIGPSFARPAGTPPDGCCHECCHGPPSRPR